MICVETLKNRETDIIVKGENEINDGEELIFIYDFFNEEKIIIGYFIKKQKRSIFKKKTIGLYLK